MLKLVTYLRGVYRCHKATELSPGMDQIVVTIPEKPIWHLAVMGTQLSATMK